MNSKTVGTKILKLRKEKGYTQTVLAERLHVSNKTISRWETGDGFPEISVLPKLAAELGTSVDCLLSQDDTDTRQSTGTISISIENHNRYAGMIKLFTIISAYEMISLLCILAKTCSMESTLISPEKILTASGYIQVLAWILMMVSCCRLYHLQKAQEQDKKNNTLLIAIWGITFLIVGFYQFLLRLVFIATLHFETGGMDAETDAAVLLFAVKIIKYIALCVCAFITSKTLNDSTVKRVTKIFIVIVIVALVSQIVAMYVGKGYGITADISVLNLFYAMFVILWRKADEKNI